MHNPSFEFKIFAVLFLFVAVACYFLLVTCLRVGLKRAHQDLPVPSR